MDDLQEVTGGYGGHGTHIAGIIGAIPNNGRQVSGVMWNCKIMPVKMVGDGSLTISYPFGGYNWDFSTTAFPSDAADAIDYAVNNGAHVINLSYGFPDMGETLNQVILRVPLLNSAILNAYNNNVVVVAAMGNDYNNGNPRQYPAAFPDVIAVGNTNNINPPYRYSSSSTGSHISVSAPGHNILSTTRGGGTETKTGTSMSAPVVSGVAGLIISQGLDRNFNLTNDDVRHILERTAHDVTSTGVGFDNQTGYGIVDAYEALHLLDEPNELFHYNSIGGTSVKTQTISQWILLSGRWGLAAGTYLNVDQYKITKHVTFDVPFCSTPQVWMRERDSKSLSYANPNSGRPFSIISNITNTGFDLEYAAYYVPTNTLGQTINKWIPETPASTNVVYTAVGVPNFAAIASISGPSIVCSSGATFTVNNASGATVSWTFTGSISCDNRTVNPTTFRSTGQGTGTIQATLITTCGNPLPAKTVSTGGPQTPVISGPGGLHCGDPYSFSVAEQSSAAGTTYSWNSDILDIDNSNLPTCTASGFNNGTGYISCTITACGVPKTATKSVNVNSCSYLLFSPNPATDQTILSIESGAQQDDIIANGWNMEVYDQGQRLKTKKIQLKNRTTTLNTSGWKDGVYIVRAIIGEEVISEKLVVKH